MALSLGTCLKNSLIIYLYVVNVVKMKDCKETICSYNPAPTPSWHHFNLKSELPSYYKTLYVYVCTCILCYFDGIMGLLKHRITKFLRVFVHVCVCSDILRLLLNHPEKPPEVSSLFPVALYRGDSGLCLLWSHQGVRLETGVPHCAE